MTDTVATRLDSESARLDYNRLRSWYLATLRKRIVDRLATKGGKPLTPAQLITADQEAVYDLVLAAARDATTKHPEPDSPRPEGYLIPALAAAPAICQTAIVLLFLFAFVPKPHMWPLVLLVCAVIAVVQFVSMKLLLKNFSSNLLRDARTQLATVNLPASDRAYLLGSPGDDQRQLENMLDRLIELLKQSLQRECAIADFALDFVFALDENMRFVAVSPSAVEFCGYTSTEMKNRKLRDVLVSDALEETIESIRETGKAPGTHALEWRLRRKDGQILDASITLEWSATESAYFCIGKDISAEKQLQRMREQFISMVGHDLRSPIAALDITLELLMQELSDKGRERVVRARETVASLLKLINELLDIERMELGQLVLVRTESDLSLIIGKAVDMIHAHARRKDIDVVAEPVDLQVIANTDRIVQVVVNLISNAIKFSPRGSEIRISTVVESRDTPVAVVKINDQGPGIAQQHCDVIFERFRQVPGTDQRSGSGLGLSICKSIVQAHDGAIGVDSKVGEGSTFWFTLPLSLPEYLK